MRKTRKKLISVLVVLSMLLSMLATTPATARTVWVSVPKSATLVAYPEHEYQFFTNVSVKPSELKTSDKSIVSIREKTKKGGFYSGYYIWLKAQRAGTATVSMKLKGKIYKTKVTVKKYINPVKSVKIGNTVLSGAKFNSASVINLSYAKFANKKVKTTVALKKGWKLDKFYNGETFKPGIEYFPKGEEEARSIVNGGRIPVKGGKGFQIYISAINQKTGEYEYISVMLK